MRQGPIWSAPGWEQQSKEGKLQPHFHSKARQLSTQLQNVWILRLRTAVVICQLIWYHKGLKGRGWGVTFRPDWNCLIPKRGSVEITRNTKGFTILTSAETVYSVLLNSERYAPIKPKLQHPHHGQTTGIWLFSVPGEWGIWPLPERGGENWTRSAKFQMIFFLTPKSLTAIKTYLDEME